MNSDPAHTINTYIEKHRDVIAPGSIEETSLHTAATMASQGQEDVAQQIINSLLIDASKKQDLLDALSGKTKEDVPAPSEEPVQQPEPSRDQQPQTVEQPATPTPELAQEVPSAPIAPPLPPTPAMPTPPPPTPTPAPQPIEKKEITQPQEPTPEILTPVEPLVEVQDPATPTAESENKKPIGLSNDVWDRFNAIVAEEKNKPQPQDGLTHLERVAQLDEAFEEAGDDVEEDQDKTITEDYDHVFGGNTHTSNMQVPGVIKTYAPAQSMVEKEQREADAHRDERLATYKKYFDAAEQYLKRATASGNESIMASAQAQFQSLKQRYPEYVQERSAHVADMQAIIDTHNQSRVEAIAHESYQLDENTTIAPGMRVTGEKDVYIVTSITQPTPEHGAEIVFTGDHTKTLYTVPADELLKALNDVDLHTDDFFVSFQQEQ